jgi:hypothetical protein
MTKQVFQTTFAGRELIVETGQVAKQANGSVVVRYGESTVLTAAVMSKKMATGDFFPLQVNYEEKMYAAGKFPAFISSRFISVLVLAGAGVDSAFPSTRVVNSRAIQPCPDSSLPQV